MFSEWSGNILAVAWILAIYFQASGGDALVLYNSSMARLVFLFEDANATYSPNINKTTNGLNAQVRDKTKQTVVDTRYLKHWLPLHLPPEDSIMAYMLETYNTCTRCR